MLLLFLVAIAIFHFSFYHNQTCLQIGNDGAAYRTYLDQQAIDRQPFTQTGVDALQGSFDAYYPLFLDYLLPSALLRPWIHSNPDKAATYFIFAIFLLIALSTAGCAVGLDPDAAFLGGFLIGILGLPGIVHRFSQLQTNFHLNPYWSQDVGLSLLIVAAFWAMNDRRWVRSGLLILASVVCLLLAILGTGAQLVFMVPATGLYCAASVLEAPHWRKNLSRVIGGLALIAVPIALGIGEYYYGLLQYNSYNFFAPELVHYSIPLTLVSTLWYSPFGRVTILLGIFGAIWASYRNPGRLRRFALVHITITSVFIAVGWAIAVFAAHYHGSVPGYFEMFIWPYSLLFAAKLILDLCRIGMGAISALLELTLESEKRRFSWIVNPSTAEVRLHGARLALSRWASPLLPHRTLATIAGIMAILLCYDFSVILREPRDFCPAVAYSPLQPTPITEALQHSLALAPGRKFNGVVATITGVDSSSMSWLDLAAHDYWLWRAVGNEHRDVGLWHFGIPTLFELFTFITPPYYLVLTDFLARPSDRQTRSEMTFTRIDEHMMPLWGVRYVITDQPTEVGTEVAQVPVTYTLPTPRKEMLRLIELPAPNIGNYSPVQVQHVDDYRTGLAALHDPQFDGERMLVTDAALEGPFVPATDVALVYESYGFHIRAESGGRSLLVLPMQYSHCWTIEGAARATLFRADLWQLGVSFRGDMNAKLIFRYGPLEAGACRVEDVRDMEQLRVAEGREHRRIP